MEKQSKVAFDIENEPTEMKLETRENLFTRFLTYLTQVKWSNVLIFSVLHSVTGLGILYFVYGPPIRLFTVLFFYIIVTYSVLGMSVGAHRLWSHRSFKAGVLFQMFLSIGQAMAMSGSVLSYTRDHRTHHKYPYTEADPMNPSKGLIYSHIGWLMMIKPQNVKDHEDFSDLQDNLVVRYQHKFYPIISVIFGVVIPTAVPVYVWQEDILTSFLVCIVFRVTLVLHHFFLVNSLANFLGNRPYDYRIRATDNRLVGYLTFGEGNQNYHHTFPYDYTSSGKQFWECYNPSTLLIEVAHIFGQAYDLKRTTPELIESTIQQTGVPACFGPPKGLCVRVINGATDWIIGSCFMLYPVIVGGMYQFTTGHVIFVW